MERKPLEVEPSTTTTNTDVVDSFEEEQRKIVYRGWKVMPFIIGNETFEKLGIIGTLSNLLVYLTSVFNLKSYTAATIINAFSGTINFGTFIAAFLCDTYFGRYKTLSVAVIACFLGSFVILLTAAIPSLHPVACGNKISCEGPSVGQILFLLMGLGFLVVGAGGIRPCNLAFGADQFNPKSESGKKGINSFFNWYFFTFTFAQIISLTAVVYIQSNVSWTIGLIIPVALMFLACVIFFAGDRLYVKVKASGSPLAGIARVIAAAIKKRGLKPVKQPWVNLYNHIPSNYANTTLKYTDQFRFLDKAAIMTPEEKLNSDGTASDPWKLCTLQQVEEVKCIVRVDSNLVCIHDILPCNNYTNDLSGLPSAPERPTIRFWWLQDSCGHLCSVLDDWHDSFHHILRPCTCPVAQKSDRVRNRYITLTKNRSWVYICDNEFISFRVYRGKEKKLCIDQTDTRDGASDRRNLINVSVVADSSAYTCRHSRSFCCHWTNGVLLQAVS
uniref:Uncharacterized protein n=1 Tax=Arabidopsis thaliana TaxID=3702 RepID=Q8H7C4_ARATH|nr:unknown [Arabidopsis thaliana]